MIVYNTTYTLPTADARNFVIWIGQTYIPRAIASGQLTGGRLMRILSHNDQESECFSLQFDTPNTATLHQWYTATGRALALELEKLFAGRAVGFSTLMETISFD